MRITWEYLLNFDYNNPFPNERTDEMLEEYSKWQIYLKENNIDINEYLFNTYLKNNDYCIEANRFPYKTPENIFHYVLWINPNYKNILTNKNILEIVINKMNELKCSGYICFENHVSVRSVLGIPHYQVFFRKC